MSSLLIHFFSPARRRTFSTYYCQHQLSTYHWNFELHFELGKWHGFICFWLPAVRSTRSLVIKCEVLWHYAYCVIYDCLGSNSEEVFRYLKQIEKWVLWQGFRYHGLCYLLHPIPVIFSLKFEAHKNSAQRCLGQKLSVNAWWIAGNTLFASLSDCKLHKENVYAVYVSRLICLETLRSVNWKPLWILENLNLWIRMKIY